MLTIAVGHSADIDIDTATGEVINHATADLDGKAAAAGLLFVADGLDDRRVVKQVHEAFPDSAIVGCTTAGEASPLLGFQEDSILLILFSSSDVRFATAIGRNLPGDPEGAANQTYRTIRDQLGEVEPRICFMLSDAVAADPDIALGHLTRMFGGPVPIVGGAAASYPPGRETHVFHGDEVVDDAMVVLALGGSLSVSAATETSWRPIGDPGRITATDGKTIRRIDDAPALDFYRRFLGDEAYVFLGNPLAILEADGTYRVRSPISFDSEANSIDVTGGVSEGDTVQLAFATVDDIRGGTDAVIKRTLENFPVERDPALVFFCSCAARKMFLALDVREEFENLKKGTDGTIPILGFYGYGEIGAASGQTPSHFCNQAIVSVAIG